MVAYPSTKGGRTCGEHEEEWGAGLFWYASARARRRH